MNTFLTVLKYLFLVCCCTLLYLIVKSMRKNSQKEKDDFQSNFLSRLDGPLMGDNPLLAAYMKSNFLKPPSTLPYNMIGDPDNINSSLYDNTLHKFLFQTFNDSGPGFFVEAGALDGEIISNTLWLELNKNWTGLLIEPNHDTCRALVLKNRKAWTSCSCLTPRKYASKTIMEIPHINDDDFFGALWLYRANVRSIESRFHTADDRIQNTASFTYASVQCFPLISYLIALNITVIDLLSLDTQGGEKTMLFNFPYDRIKVRYMVIEYFKKGPKPKEVDSEFVEFMKEKNYKLINHLDKSSDYTRIFGLNE